jgi:hypothetical protein
MTKRSILILLSLIVVAGLTTSCILDPKEQKEGDDTKPPVVFKDLLEKDDVLFNLELAYLERNAKEYDRLLDDNFTFIFSEADYNSGEVDFPQWDRNTEVLSTVKILDPDLAGDKRVISIDLDVEYAVDNWTELPENEDHPGESWFTQTVDYNLTIKTADDWEHRANGLKAQFTIRWAETDDGDHWRVILWRDDVGN